MSYWGNLSQINITLLGPFQKIFQIFSKISFSEKEMPIFSCLLENIATQLDMVLVTEMIYKTFLFGCNKENNIFQQCPT